MISYLISVSLCFYAALTLTEGGKCPDNPSQAMQKCAESLALDLDKAQGHLFVTDAEYTKKMCQGDDVNKAIQCMETIYNDCTGEGGMIDKDMLAKPESWRMGLKSICDNRQFLTDNAACVSKGLSDRQTCIKDYESKAAADTELKKIGLASENKEGQREMFQIVCQLTENLMDCFDKTLIKDCPKKMETIIDSVIHKFLPPICHPAGSGNGYDHVSDENKNSGVALSVSVTLMVTLMLCLLK